MKELLLALLRAILLDSPISRLGFLWASVVGCVWGFICSTGRVRKDGGVVVFTGLPPWAFRRGGVCVGIAYLTDRNDSARVLDHERIHVRQWRRYGFLFPLLYALAGADPLKNRYEIEAGLEDGGYR